MSDGTQPDTDQRETGVLRHHRQSALAADLARPLRDDEVEWLDADLS